MDSPFPLDPARPLDVHDLNAATVDSVIRHLGASSRPELLVYRESELDPLWTLADMASRRPGAGAAALGALDSLWRAHDLVGEGRCAEAGIPSSAADEDRAVTVGMRPVVNRSREHLATTDIAIIAARRRLLRMVRDLERGLEPEAPRDPNAYAVRALEVTEPVPDFGTLLPTVQKAMTVDGGAQLSTR
jgi:hypothetical protein